MAAGPEWCVQPFSADGVMHAVRARWKAKIAAVTRCGCLWSPRSTVARGCTRQALAASGRAAAAAAAAQGAARGRQDAGLTPACCACRWQRQRQCACQRAAVLSNSAWLIGRASGMAGVILRLTWLGAAAAAAARAGMLVDDFARDIVIQSGARGLAAANGAGGALAWTSFLDPSPRAQPAPSASTWPCPPRVCSFVLSVVPPPNIAHRSQSLIPTADPAHSTAPPFPPTTSLASATLLIPPKLCPPAEQQPNPQLPQVVADHEVPLTLLRHHRPRRHPHPLPGLGHSLDAPVHAIPKVVVGFGAQDRHLWRLLVRYRPLHPQRPTARL